jgi:uncharacterized iron-regulated protein
MKSLIFSLIIFLPLTSWAKYVKKPEANIEKRKAAVEAPPPVILTTSAPNFCIFGGQSGKQQQGEAAFNSVVWRSDVVYVGETGQPLDHLAQFEALKAMRIARGSKIAVGFEALDRTLQPALNDFAEGKIGEAEFLAKTGDQKELGFDYAAYKPLFDFIARNKLRALALNVPQKVAGKIARSGLGSLTPEERAFLPEKVEVSQHKKYNEYLKTSFAGTTTENQLASLAAANESMGARIAEFLGGNPGYSVLVLAGNGRLAYNAAIPASVKARLKDARQASFYLEHAEKCPEAMPREHKDLANYLWYVKHPPKPAPAPAAAN